MADLESGFVAVGFDGTPESTAALRWALGRSAATRVPLKIVHCWPVTSPPGQRDWRGCRQFPAPRREDMVHRVEDELATARTLVPAPPGVSVVFAAAPVESVLATQARGASMLVLGASSPAVLADPRRGPVAGPCLNLLRCTVVVLDRRGRVATAEPRYPALGLAG